MGMPEAWQGTGHTWPSNAGGAPGNGSILEAAAHLGVGVFASAPLQEGQLLQDTSLRVSHGRGQRPAEFCAVSAHRVPTGCEQHATCMAGHEGDCGMCGPEGQVRHASTSAVRNVQERLERELQLQHISEPAPKLLQMARSTLLVTAAIIGHKKASHVQANLEVGKSPIISPADWTEAVERLRVQSKQ